MITTIRKKIIIILMPIAAAWFISQNFYQLNMIWGDSMYPAYKNMQLTIIDKRADSFKRGDVIIFYCPSLDLSLVKRIIAIPGDTVLIENGNVFVNGAKSPHVNGSVDFGGTAVSGLALNEESFFVLGDNYTQSKDSRYEEIGCVRRENIIGRLIPNVLYH